MSKSKKIKLWPEVIDLITSGLVTIIRGLHGISQKVEPPETAPKLELYEFEACPYCRLVRETVSELQLEIDIYPCAPGSRYREVAYKIAGKRTTFPFLVDYEVDKKISDSKEIIAHLWHTYGKTKPPWRSPLAIPTSILGTLVRGNRGSKSVEAEEPKEKLILYAFEGSPYCRIVREVLTMLQLPYHQVTIAKESFGKKGESNCEIGGRGREYREGTRRARLKEEGGKVLIPFLIDPNTGKRMYESRDIVRYLVKTYQK